MNQLIAVRGMTRREINPLYRRVRPIPVPRVRRARPHPFSVVHVDPVEIDRLPDRLHVAGWRVGAAVRTAEPVLRIPAQKTGSANHALFQKSRTSTAFVALRAASTSSGAGDAGTFTRPIGAHPICAGRLAPRSDHLHAPPMGQERVVRRQQPLCIARPCVARLQTLVLQQDQERSAARSV